MEMVLEGGNRECSALLHCSRTAGRVHLLLSLGELPWLAKHAESLPALASFWIALPEKCKTITPTTQDDRQNMSI